MYFGFAFPFLNILVSKLDDSGGKSGAVGDELLDASFDVCNNKMSTFFRESKSSREGKTTTGVNNHSVEEDGKVSPCGERPIKSATGPGLSQGRCNSHNKITTRVKPCTVCSPLLVAVLEVAVLPKLKEVWHSAAPILLNIAFLERYGVTQSGRQRNQG